VLGASAVLDLGVGVAVACRGARGAQCLRSSQRSLCSACELGTSLTALVAGVALLLASVVLQYVLLVPLPITCHQVLAGDQCCCLSVRCPW
jgi:hypothetical protein